VTEPWPDWRDSADEGFERRPSGYRPAALLRARVEGRVRGIPGWHEVGWDHVQFMRAVYPMLTAPQLEI